MKRRETNGSCEIRLRKSYDTARGMVSASQTVDKNRSPIATKRMEQAQPAPRQLNDVDVIQSSQLLGESARRENADRVISGNLVPKTDDDRSVCATVPLRQFTLNRLRKVIMTLGLV